MTEETAARRPSASRVTEIAIVLTLSITAVLTAWCGFEASKWGGEMSIAFSEASSARIQASAAESRAAAARQYDLSIYTEWVRATAEDDEALADYVEDRFSPELATAFAAWDAAGRAENGPLVVAEYVPPGSAEAESLSARADERFADALENNQRGDNYSLLTVLFALVLFFAALSQAQRVVWRQRTFLASALVLAAIGLAWLATFPIKI
ncbi:hypothetical protein [Microbacterium excoecariae]|uniref:hypothetical protein n=1 Tax=Microbacterium excoecariae TaxID=2715210 RepID=UPI00140CB827|nr:hypothetical protein [Microbacterium excoecariae]NHI17153.1 hypothetical protein [Microbacterium excoecariae]